MFFFCAHENPALAPPPLSCVRALRGCRLLDGHYQPGLLTALEQDFLRPPTVTGSRERGAKVNAAALERTRALFAQDPCEGRPAESGYRGGAVLVESDVVRQQRRCNYCGESPPKLLKCAQCQATFYCNANCQRSHWKNHKKECEKKT